MNNSKIITVTLNPSLDRTLTAHYLAAGYPNRTTQPTLLYPAGRGVNISCALHALKYETHAVVSLGDDAIGLAYKTLITEEGFPVKILKRPGQTRSNIVILDTGHETETHLIEESTGVTPDHLQSVADAVKEIVNAGDIVVYAGTLPTDVPLDTYNWLIDSARQAGAVVALATDGELLKQALDAKPDLVAVSQIQLEWLFNHPVRTQQDVIYCAESMLEKGIGRILVISAKSDSALLVTEEDAWRVDLPEFEPGTSSGVEDAMLAGYLASRALQIPLNSSLKIGAASATYTASQVGNEFGSPSEVAEFINDVDVSPQETP